MNAAQEKIQAASATERDPRWASVMARDHDADGQFYYSVKTTGVYCRPSCASRRARSENVAFHATAAEAEHAGFRPCRRCKPDQAPLAQTQVAIVTRACRTIEDSIERAEQAPSLDALAQQAGLSSFHFHRLFKSMTGLTPKAYASAHRSQRLRSGLTQARNRAGSITEAIFDAGYPSSARVYEHANEVLGMTPSAYRAGGVKAVIQFAVGECSLGAILVARSEKGLCAILLGDDPQALTCDLQDRFPKSTLTGGDADFERLVSQVVGFVEAPKTGLNLPLDVRGTAFQQRVWQALQQIPPGTTASYTDIAQRIGQPSAVRAVAAACGANALAIAIPCHRVVRNDGALSGYRWGVERKRALLDRETKV